MRVHPRVSSGKAPRAAVSPAPGGARKTPAARGYDSESKLERGRGGVAPKAPKADKPATRARAAKPEEITPKTHPHWFTAAGERKWKVPPPDVQVIPNRDGAGEWIEKWRSPKSGKWVHNYTVASMARRAGDKFVKNREVGRVLPAVREKVRQDILGNGREAVVALVVLLIDLAYFRVGNEDSGDNEVFGATTLQAQHVTLERDRAVFEFVGKHRIEQHKLVADPQLLAGLRRLLRKKQPADRLFAHGGQAIEAREVNAYLEVFGMTAKQFRTYHATRMMHAFLRRHADAPASAREAVLAEGFERVAAELGHTPQVSREHYVDPHLVAAYIEGRLS